MTDSRPAAPMAPARSPIVVERTYRAAVEELWALWTTKEGFESWWGPQGFRAEVYAIDPVPGGTLHYAMIAATPEMIAVMQEMNRPASHETHSRFAACEPYERLTITSVIDFLPGVPAYESDIRVEFFPQGEHVRMVVTLSPMHDEAFSGMQREGFGSQLTKLDARYGWVAS